MMGTDSVPIGWPMRLTLFRLGMVPFLWLLAALGATSWLAIGAAVAALTDVVDGILARLLNQRTERGSRLDSIADHLLSASLVCWLIWLRPDFVRGEIQLLAGWAALGVTALVVGWVKHRRIGDLHLYSSKVAGTLAYLLAIWVLFSGTYSRLALYLVAAVAILAAVESILVFSTRRTVDERIGSVLLRPGRAARREEGKPPLTG